METIKNTTFNLFDVESCREPLPTTSTFNILKEINKKEPNFHSGKEDQVVLTPYHGLIGTVTRAYNMHYPLVLDPDSIWITITQGLAQHINANAEELRGQFVKHDEKKYIEIQRGGAPRDDDELWQGALAEFSSKIKEHIGKKHDLIVADFSTTTPVALAASEIVLMGAMKSYFKYGMRFLCGIPNITLEGTVEDWKSIRTRAQCFGEFNLGWWVDDHLLPVLDQFVAASEGNPDKEFWKSMVKEGGGSGGPFICGWINALLPYVGSRDIKVNKTFKRHERYGNYGEGFGGINPDDYASSMACAPVKFIYQDGTEEMKEFIGGIIGIEQRENFALKPKLGWAIQSDEEILKPKPKWM
ncbi:hypothetical protein LCGC14_0533420 [marine sediment metagenome]|uniref:DUF4419 domain-containing protein n=1 Tax=marine sediment metagenome TaxID=412755 RepID=A0A0F9SDC8_9ZZZZ